jgi:transposase
MVPESRACLTSILSDHPHRPTRHFAGALRLLGLDGFEVLAADIVRGEWRLAVQTTASVVGCQGCGVRAELHGRRTVRVRDLPIGGRPVVLAWRKRIWRCREPACGVRTWTERVWRRSARGQC